METRPEASATPTQQELSQTEAELIFTVANRAPEVILSFEGLAAPTPLFVDLNRLGWTIPAVPPPPSSAIDWTPDPVAGTDYTLLPWRVPEFRLVPGGWAQSSERAIGGLTIEVLRNHGVNITSVRGLSDAEIQAATAPAVKPVPETAAPTASGQEASDPVATSAAPTPSATSEIIFVYDPEPHSELTGFRTYSAIHGRKKHAATWHEGILSEGAQVPDAAAMADLQQRGGGVWHLSGDERPRGSGGIAVVQMLAPDFSASDPQVKKLLKLTGETTQVIPLASLSGGKDGVLFCLRIPSNSVAMLGSNLRIRFPNLIFREG